MNTKDVADWADIAGIPVVDSADSRTADLSQLEMFAQMAVDAAKAEWAIKFEQSAYQHQLLDGAYAAGKKAGVLECIEALRG